MQRLTWNGVLRVDAAAGGEGDGGRVVLLLLLPPPVEQQQGQQQDHQEDQHHNAADGPPGLLLARGQRNHDAAHLLRGVCWKKKTLTAAFNTLIHSEKEDFTEKHLLNLLFVSARTVLAGGPPVARTTHALPGFLQTRVAVGAALGAALVTVRTPKTLGTGLTAAWA